MLNLGAGLTLDMICRGTGLTVIRDCISLKFCLTNDTRLDHSSPKGKYHISSFAKQHF